MLLSKAVDRFLAWRQLERDATPKSLDSYWRILAKLDAHLEARLGAGVRLGDLEGRRGTDLLREFLAAHVGSRSAATRSNWISVLHSFFGWAEAEDLIEADPSRRIRRPPKRKPDVYRPSETELLLGRRACLTEELPPWLLMEGVGLRASSVTGCRWEHVDLTRGRVRAHVKGNHWILLPVEPEILHELQAAYALLEPEPDDHVFAVTLERWETSEHRRRYVRDPKVRSSEKALWTMVRRVCERAGIRPVGPHALRHGFALRLTRRGLPREQIQALMGHAHPSTTEQYLPGIELERLEEALGALSQPDSEPAAQPSSRVATWLRGAAKPLVEAAGIEPASDVDEPPAPSVTGDDEPIDPESGVT